MTWSATPIPEWRPRRFPALKLRQGSGDGPPVALVLGLQRTASTSAMAVLRAALSADMVVARHHGLSERHRDWLERGRAMGLPNFEAKPTRLAAARAAIAAARQVDVLVTVREPAARAVSFFLYRNRARIRDFHDRANGGFREAESIARDLRAFCSIEARRQAVWFREELGHGFGCDPEELARGPVRRGGVNLLLVRCEQAEADLRAACRTMGAEPPPARRRNDAAELGLAEAARDFARAFPLPGRLNHALAGRGDIRLFYPAAVVEPRI